jgi:hypothetical protein
MRDLGKTPICFVLELMFGAVVNCIFYIHLEPIIGAQPNRRDITKYWCYLVYFKQLSLRRAPLFGAASTPAQLRLIQNHLLVPLYFLQRVIYLALIIGSNSDRGKNLEP